MKSLMCSFFLCSAYVPKCLTHLIRSLSVLNKYMNNIFLPITFHINLYFFHQSLSDKMPDIQMHNASKFQDKPTKVNWSNHASYFEGFSFQDKFLTSAFLFSLSTQKPQPEKRADEISCTRFVFSYRFSCCLPFFRQTY